MKPKENPTFVFFLCLECFSLYIPEKGERHCRECNSPSHRLRYVQEDGVATVGQAFEFFRNEMNHERNKLNEILIKLKPQLWE